MSVKTREILRRLARPVLVKNLSHLQPCPKPIRRHLPAWLVLAAVLAILTPRVAVVTIEAGGRIISTIPDFVGRLLRGSSVIAPLFSPEVQHWGHNMNAGRRPMILTPICSQQLCKLSLAVTRQSTVTLVQGLFQVMPFNFQVGDNYLDPETNAERGANVLKQCIGFADGDKGLAMACYNGGPSVLYKPFAAWSDGTRNGITIGVLEYTKLRRIIRLTVPAWMSGWLPVVLNSARWPEPPWEFKRSLIKTS